MKTEDKLNKMFDQLLHLYDFQIRNVAKVQQARDNGSNESEDYVCGYADAIGQCILDASAILGSGLRNPDGKAYESEAHKRVMNFTSAAQYVRDYPKPEQSQ